MITRLTEGRILNCERCGVAILGKSRRFCSRDCRSADDSTPEKRSARFWAKVDKSAGPDKCWLYMGFRKWDGYGWVGRMTNGKRTYYTAHRYAWMLTNGDPATGLHVLHRCDNPPCCNPAHLWLGTHDDNMRDRTAKGRSLGPKVIWTDRVRPERKRAAG